MTNHELNDQEHDTPDVNEETVEEVQKEKAPKGSWKEDLKLFVPSREIAVTQLLVLINVLIYIWMVVSGVDPLDPSVDDLVIWGGNIDVLFSEGEYWRLLASCFIHIGFVHLLMNMYALLYVGSFLETIIGHRRFLLAYLVTGLISSLASTWWHTNIVSAGASGAIFGMFGVFLVLLLSHRIVQGDTRKELLTSIGIFVAYNLLFGLQGEVDNAAHIGGLLSGMAVGWIYMMTLTRPELGKMRLMESGVPVLLLIVMFIFTYNVKGGSTTYLEQEKVFNQVFEIIDRAENEFQSDDNASYRIKRKELDAYKHHMDSTFILIDDYYNKNGNEEENPYLRQLADYLKVTTDYRELYLEYQKSGYDSTYEIELKELMDKTNRMLEEINE